MRKKRNTTDIYVRCNLKYYYSLNIVSFVKRKIYLDGHVSSLAIYNYIVELLNTFIPEKSEINKLNFFVTYIVSDKDGSESII